MQHQDRRSDWARRDDRIPPLWLVLLALGVQMMAFALVLAQSGDAWLTRQVARGFYRYDMVLCRGEPACEARARDELRREETMTR
jgi:hypothetical protein